MENHNFLGQYTDAPAWQDARFCAATVTGGDRVNHEAWGNRQATQPGEDLGKFFETFARQGNMMTDADWKTFGKLYLDFASNEQQQCQPHIAKPLAHALVKHHHPHQVSKPQPLDVSTPMPPTASNRSINDASTTPPQEVSTPPPHDVSNPQDNVARPLEQAVPGPANDASSEINFPLQRGPTMTGSQFFRDVLHADAHDSKVKGLTGAEREKAILKQVEAGNVPDFLRHAKEVHVTDGKGNTAVMNVMPDYLAIGTNDDYVRVPVTPVLAKTIAEKYGLALPTKKVVDDIYKNADVKLTGQGLVHDLSDTKYMDGNGFYLKHNQKIDSELRGQPQDALVAGQKKDIIVSKFAQGHPDRLDFYGLFDKSGHAIQGAHGGPHENTYVDYSHGARFISQNMIVNGKPMTYDQVLKDPQLAGLLSDEGTLEVDSIYKQPIHSEYMAVA